MVTESEGRPEAAEAFTAVMLAEAQFSDGRHELASQALHWQGTGMLPH